MSSTSSALSGWNPLEHHSRAARSFSSRRRSYSLRMRSALSYLVVTGGPPPGGVSVPVEDDGWSAGGKRPAGGGAGSAGSAVSTVAPERIDKDPTAAPGYALRVIDGDPRAVTRGQ